MYILVKLLFSQDSMDGSIVFKDILFAIFFTVNFTCSLLKDYRVLDYKWLVEAFHKKYPALQCILIHDLSVMLQCRKACAFP